MESSSEPTMEIGEDDSGATMAAAFTSTEEGLSGGGNSGYGTYKSGSNYYASSNGGVGDGGGGSSSSSSSYGESSSFGNSAIGGSSSHSGGGEISSSSIGGGSYYSSSSAGGDAITSSYYDNDGYSSSRYKSSSSTTKSKFATSQHKPLPTITISIIPAILFLLFLTLGGMLLTAHRMEHNPEGYFANFCRVVLHSITCFSGLLYNLYHGRWGDIVQRALGDEDDEEDYTDEEMERMKLRPGIERALDVEHTKALRRVGIEMEKITSTKKSNTKSSRGR
jgi:hypothetical protein